MYIVKANSKKKKVKLEDFLIKFVPKKIRKSGPPPVSKVSTEEKAKNKAAVLAMFGMNPKGEFKAARRTRTPPKRKE